MITNYWKLIKITPEGLHIYTSLQWLCSDNDIAMLYIDAAGSLTLHCFSGLPSSYIELDWVDFENFRGKVTIPTAFEIANYLCSLFCESYLSDEFTEI